MKSFYLVKNKEIKQRLYDYEVSEFSVLCPPQILKIDIENWLNQANHGDSFQINYNITILCLDLEKFNI